MENTDVIDACNKFIDGENDTRIFAGAPNFSLPKPEKDK
jgi:hypothetical protein